MKKVLIGLVIVILIGLVFWMYLDNRNRTLSPAGAAELSNGPLNIALTYSRPSVKDRVIFGTEDDEALQPYGVYWRLGANESTEITFNSDILFASKHVSAGTYRMYAVPNPDFFEISLNTQLGEWGYFEPDYSLDVVKVNVPVIKDGFTEQHTISLLPSDKEGIDIIISFAEVKLVIPVTLQ